MSETSTKLSGTKGPRVGVIRFPGTNCDRDVWGALGRAGLNPVWLWHADRADFTSLKGVVIPGGFSYGDYLRCGALAARSPVMRDLPKAAQAGLPILGICNGFQVLCESGILPGVLMRNRTQRFIDTWVDLAVVAEPKGFASSIPSGSKIRLPIAHGEGRYFAPREELDRLEGSGRVWLCYAEDINGSERQIAGIMSEGRNVLGLMPHPERAMASWMGGADGLHFFTSLIS